MQRRTFLMTVGGAVTTGAAALGSGAFSQAEADRGATVSVVDDSGGAVAITDNLAGDAVKDTSGTVEIDLTGTPYGGSGVNRNTTFRLGDGDIGTAATAGGGAIQIANNLTNTTDNPLQVEVDVPAGSDDVSEITVYLYAADRHADAPADDTDQDSVTGEGTATVEHVTGTVDVVIEVVTEDSTGNDFSGDLTVRATRTDPPSPA